MLTTKKRKAHGIKLCITCSARSWISGIGSTIMHYLLCQVLNFRDWFHNYTLPALPGPEFQGLVPQLCITCSARSWISGIGSTITLWKMCLRASCSTAAVQLIPLPTLRCVVRVRRVCKVARRTDDVLWHRKGHKRGTTSLSGCGLWKQHANKAQLLDDSMGQCRLCPST